MTSPAPLRRAFPPDATVSEWVTPDGWPLRRLDWANPAGRGRILIQGGRGDVLEKYLETFAHFHARGWSVTAFDWRGQGGSGRLAPDPHVGHADDFAPWIADLGAVWHGWSAEMAGPRAILGHSMGGYLVLRALLDRAVDPDAAVLVAPMLGLKSPLGVAMGARIARWMARRDPTRAAWKGNERPGAVPSRQKLLTHDVARYDDEQWWYAHDPAIRLGPPSWGWLAEAFAATGALAGDPRLAAMTVPLLALIAEHDGLVAPRAALRIVDRLPDSQVVRFGRESAHEILREADPVRLRALAVIDAFLDARAPA
jgi:lysophospholipase